MGVRQEIKGWRSEVEVFRAEPIASGVLKAVRSEWFGAWDYAAKRQRGMSPQTIRERNEIVIKHWGNR